jgi:tRNA pseudouridine38-40 synthase
LTIEYDGGPFMGWQRQDHGPSVQQSLEEALERMTGEQAAFNAAGRTDAGVHALAMSAHVDVAKSLTAHRLREGLNALVRPQPISVLDVEEVADDWHARFS